MDEIIGHRSNEHAIKQQDAFIITKTGTKRRKETTKGWELLIRWKDGGTDWVALKDVKESYPVQVAEYTVLARISEEPAFAWGGHHQSSRNVTGSLPRRSQNIGYGHISSELKFPNQ